MKRRFITILLILSLVFSCFAVDTARTRAALVTIFGDNVAGDISAQDLRDLLISVHLMTDLDQVVTVAKAGGQYTLIQSAIDSISDAASDKIYTVLVYPGEYDEAITLSDYVDIVAINPENTKILQPITDNSAECHCYLNISIASVLQVDGAGLYISNSSSTIVFDGNISSQYGEGIAISNGTVTINGDISSGINTGLLISNGTVTINGNISGEIAILISGGTLTIVGNLYANWDNSDGQGVRMTGGTIILQNSKIFCTHADAKSIYASDARDAYCMGVWANRDDHANITQKITGGFTFDSDVP